MTPESTAPHFVDDDYDDPHIEIGGLRIDILEGAFSWYIRSLDSVVSRDLDRRMAELEVAKGKGKITTLFLVDDYPGVRPSQVADVLMRPRKCAKSFARKRLNSLTLSHLKTATSSCKCSSGSI